MESKFIGKIFVFDEHVGESIDGRVISHCHQCGKFCDLLLNCSNNRCNLLFIQCTECTGRYGNYCAQTCCNVKNATKADKQNYILKNSRKFSDLQICRKNFSLANKNLPTSSDPIFI